jgi:hypothetical protein
MSFVMFPPLIRFRASATKISTSDQRRAQMQYVDGFVLPIPKKNLQAYRRIAQKAGTIWREHGALDYRECVADDVKVGKLTSFPRSVNALPRQAHDLWRFQDSGRPLAWKV